MKQPNHYVDNEKFQLAMIDYHSQYQKSLENNQEPPRIPRYIAECIMKIATHLSFLLNFTNYSFKDEMIQDGIYVCCKYAHNYDPNKFKNPHAYFTTAVWRAFVQRIKLEKNYLYKKHVATQIAELNDSMSESQDHDNKRYKTNDYGEWTQEQIARFMEEFESNRGKRRKKILDKAKLDE